jgi:predicted amidohydrolase
MKQNPFKDERDLGVYLRRPSPARQRLFWIFPVIIVILAVRAYFWFTPEPDTVVPLSPTPYTVAEDPEDAARKKFIEQEPQTPKKDDPSKTLGEIKPGYFRVAAAQIQSKLAAVEANRGKMTAFIRKAAALKVNIIVFPEGALQGYADLSKWRLWADDPEKAEAESEIQDFVQISGYAESATGSEVEYFQDLAKENKIYIVLPYIEVAGGVYYSSLALIDSQGRVILRERKHKLWATADLFWAKSGQPEQKLVETPYGRIGLAISYDITARMRAAKAQGADLILHSSAFYGENLERWMGKSYAPLVMESGAAVVFANWGMSYTPDWSGYGMSRIYDRGGKMLAARGEEEGEFLVVADLPLSSAVKSSGE